MFGFRKTKRPKSRRPAVPGEYCTCGRPAAVVFRSPAFGEVGSCLSLDPQPPARPCLFCGTTGRHVDSAVCPSYVLRPAWATEPAQAALVAARGGEG